MAVIVNKNQDQNDALTQRITADLRNKMAESADVSGEKDPDMVEDSEYVKNMKHTSKFGWVWIVLIVLAIIALIIIIVP
ncbi:hypothetical protein IJG04_01885 [Candidatus Saccharibacteria bacterium]|nr:hypothetical protein [Candidatus Saccharibacteria bacterium]